MKTKITIIIISTLLGLLPAQAGVKSLKNRTLTLSLTGAKVKITAFGLNPVTKVKIFTYDSFTSDGDLIAQNSAGAYYGNKLIFTFTYLNGLGFILAKFDKNFNSARYVELFTSDRTCLDPNPTTGIFACQLDLGQIVSVEEGRLI